MSRSHLPGVELQPRTARTLALALAGLRVGLGVAAYALPRFVATPWVGAEDASTPGGKVLGRALGSRDVALGLGALLAARHGTPVRGWVEGGLLADSGDTATMLSGWKRLPPLTRWPILALTIGSVALAAAAAPFVDE